MDNTITVDELDGLLRIGEAARLLGVTTKTLRNWDQAGKLVPLRHPVTGYRHYQKGDLDKILKEGQHYWQKKARKN